MYTIPARIRRFVALTILLFATSQPANAFDFEKPSSTSEQVQLATAILSLPISIAAQEHPDSQAFACLEHAVKAVNEFVACGNTNAFYNGPWFLYDTYKTIASIVALAIGSSDTDLEALNNDDVIHPEADTLTEDTPSATEATPGTNAGERHIKRIASTLLACTEGALRIHLALCNNRGVSNAEKGYLAWYKVLLSSALSLTRIANNCLPSNNKYRSYALALLCAHLISTYYAYRGYRETVQPFEIEQEQKRIMAEREAVVLTKLQALPAQHKPTLETDDVVTVFEAFWISKKDENYLIEANKFPDDIDAFCRQHQLPPIFTRREGQDGSEVNDDLKSLFNDFIPWMRQDIHDEQQKNSAVPIAPEAVKLPLRGYRAQGIHHLFGAWSAGKHGQIPGFSSQATPANGQSTPQAPAQPTQPNRLTEAECLRILGLPATATLPDIERRFRQLGLTEHPDKKRPEEHAEATQNWQRISDARRILKNDYHHNEATKQSANTVVTVIQETQTQTLTDVD